MLTGREPRAASRMSLREAVIHGHKEAGAPCRGRRTQRVHWASVLLGLSLAFLPTTSRSLMPSKTWYMTVTR